MNELTALWDWAFGYLIGYPWVWCAVFVCSWAAHVLTQWIKGYRKELTGSKPGKYALKAYSFGFAATFSAFALLQSPHIASAERALFLGLMIGFCHTFLISLAFKITESRFPAVNAALSGELYDDDPTEIKTFVAAIAGAKVRPDRRHGDADKAPAGVDRRQH